MESIENLQKKVNYDFKFDFNFMEIPSINLLDIVDILIVAFIIYKVLIWFKDTRAWALFKGIMFILFITVLALILKLNTTLWIFQNTINVGIIAVLIVFQPELRRALEQLGSGNIFANLISMNEEDKENKEGLPKKIVEQIIKACEQMSKTKTGALIAIEQEIKLGDYERTGISIDAKVSSQLLVNIFEHNTPLHDGAIIIKDDRILAATCYLPLSDNLKISKSLGTRHRAALGLSEVSDSKIIIVSEETGKISMAYMGVIHRDIDSSFIKRQLIHEDKKKNEVRKFVIWKGRNKG